MVSLPEQVAILGSTPNEVYEFMNPFTYKEISSKEEFHGFVKELFRKEIIVSINRDENRSDSLGFQIARNETKSPLDSPFAYLGNNSEKVWTNLMLGLRKTSAMYGFQLPADSSWIQAKYVYYGSFHGKRTLSVRSIGGFVLNRDGVLNAEEKAWDVPGFIECLKNGLVDVEDFDIQLVRYLFQNVFLNRSRQLLIFVQLLFNLEKDL